MKKVSLRKAIQIVFPKATNIKLSKGYYYCSGFFQIEEQPYYICTTDIRMNHLNSTGIMGIMYRKTKDYKDYTGETNQWDFNKRLQEKGYMISSVPHKTC